MANYAETAGQAGPSTWLILGIIGGVIVLVLLLWKFWKPCTGRHEKRDRRTPGADQLRRRRLQHPLLSYELECDSHIPREKNAKSIDLEVAEILTPRLVLLSCVTQVIWLVLGYFIFKKFKKYRAEAQERREGVIPLYA